jgi:hypothetical protein
VSASIISRTGQPILDTPPGHRLTRPDRNELEWNPGIESIDKLTDGSVGLGTKYLAKWKSAPKAVEVGTIAYDRPAANMTHLKAALERRAAADLAS